MIRVTEAERLVKNSIKWEGKTTRVSVFRKGEKGKQKLPITKKVLVQRKKKERKRKRDNNRGRPLSRL